MRAGDFKFTFNSYGHFGEGVEDGLSEVAYGLARGEDERVESGEEGAVCIGIRVREAG